MPDAHPKIELQKIRLDKNQRRFYALEIQRDLFGRIVICRTWGRIGTSGRQRLNSHENISTAIDDLKKSEKSKHRRGYRNPMET